MFTRQAFGLARQTKKSVGALRTSKRTAITSPSQVITPQGSYNTDDVIKYFKDRLGEPEQYQSKYADKTIEDWKNEAFKELKKPFYYDDSMSTFAIDMLGYKKEEVQMTLSGDLPDVTIKPELPIFEGDRDIDWEKAKKLYANTSVRRSAIGDIERSMKRFRVQFAEVEKTTEIDWNDWKQHLPADLVEEVRQDVETALSMYKPLDPALLQKTINDALKPVEDRMKDYLFDALPFIREISDTIAVESQFLRCDEFGVPLVDIGSPDFLDQYYPELRDQIIEEIETDEWDVEYKEEAKKIKFNPEVALTYNEDMVTKENEKFDEGIKYELTVAASVTPEAKAFQKMYLDVINTARQNNALEAEVTALKYQLEQESEEKTKAAAEGEAKEEKKIDPEVDEILNRILNKQKVEKVFPGVKKRNVPQKKQEDQAEAAH